MHSINTVRSGVADPPR